jgi:hypothetical protein
MENNERRSHEESFLPFLCRLASDCCSAIFNDDLLHEILHENCRQKHRNSCSGFFSNKKTKKNVAIFLSLQLKFISAIINFERNRKATNTRIVTEYRERYFKTLQTHRHTNKQIQTQTAFEMMSFLFIFRSNGEAKRKHKRFLLFI